jgi:hypothetical protein
MKPSRTILRTRLKEFLLKIPIVNTKVRNYLITNSSGWKPGHYYSPIPDIFEIEANAERIFANKSLTEIDLNTSYQIRLLDELKEFYAEYPYNLKSSEFHNHRYKKDGAFYRYSDSVFLYSIMRRFNPKKIIEIGSGHSSAVMLDINELFCNNTIQFTFIEPYPDERLMSIIRESDYATSTILKTNVQSVKLDVFDVLGENDILFIDSTHITKVGSDVNFLLFEVLPSLKTGVLIHFHDIFYPFEMPRHWILKKRWYWNETYLLHAFLMNNRNYEIVAFNSYLQSIRPDWFEIEMPECLIGSEDTGSLWIRKIG